MKASFRLRIAIFSAAISGVVLVGFGLAAWFWLRHERRLALDREIRALAYRHPGWMNNQANYERLGSAIEFIFGDEPKGRVIIAALDTDRTVRYRSPAWPAEIDPAWLDLTLGDEVTAGAEQESEGATGTSLPSIGSPGGRRGWGGGAGAGVGAGAGAGHGPGWGRRGVTGDALFTKKPRFVTVVTSTTTWRLGVLGNNRDRLVVGLDTAEMEAEMGRMRMAFGLALPLALGLIGGGGWLVAGRAVRPLRRIAEAAEGVTARGLDQRLPDSAEDPEIRRLVGVLNRMMDRLEASFRQATRFGADASHELKTPLAVMQGELEQALQRAAEGSAEQRTFVSLLEETQRLKVITRSLLLLAQADSGRMPLTRVRWDATAEVRALIEDVQVLADAAGLDVRTDLAPAVWVSADRVLLRLAISNLLENAVHYNQPGGWIAVALRSEGSSVVLEVSNAGPGIAPGDEGRVFERFHRGAEARHRRRDGMGLGLSLAREIVIAHQGELILVRPGPEPTVFRLSLPAAPAGAEESH